MSKQREKFYAAKAAKRKRRADDAYHAAHTFECTGLRRRHGKENQQCGWPVTFRRLDGDNPAENERAFCRRCRTAFIYYVGSVDGVFKQTWLTVEEHGELYIPDESKTTLESVYREIDAEKNVKDKQGYMQQVQETIVIADHAPWCKSKDVPIIGLRAKMGAPGRVRWTDSGGRVRHLCQSSKAASHLGKIGAVARWGEAR